MKDSELHRLQQLSHTSCCACQQSLMCSDGADNPFDRGDDQDDAAPSGCSRPRQDSGDHLLQVQPVHSQAFHGSSDHHHEFAAAQHCSLLTQSFHAQESASASKDADAQGISSSSIASYEAAGRHESCIKHRQGARCTDDEADQRFKDEKQLIHAHDQDPHNQPLQESSSQIRCASDRGADRHALCSRRSLAQAFASEDYSDFLVLLGQSSANLASEESLKHSLTSINPNKEPSYIKLCSSSSKCSISREHHHSYIMKGVGLAFKWRPTISTSKLSSLFGGHLISKTSSARVWVQEDDSSCCNAKPSAHTPHLCPQSDKNPFFLSSSFHKPTIRENISENFAKYSEKPSRFSHTSIKEDSPTLTRFGSSLVSGFLPGSSSFHSGSASFNFGTSIGTHEGRSTRSGSLCSSKNGSSLEASSFTSFDHRSKLGAHKKPPHHHEPWKLKRLFLRKTKLEDHEHGFSPTNRANCKNARNMERNCYASVISFNNVEDLSKESIKGAIAHCKQSMATTNHSNAFVLS